MKFKPPGGDLNWMTPLMFFASGALVYDYLNRGLVGFAIFFGVLGICAGLIWFQQRWAAWPLIALGSLGVIGGIISLFMKGFAWLTLFKTISTIYFVIELRSWVRKLSEERREVKELLRDDTFRIE